MRLLRRIGIPGIIAIVIGAGSGVAEWFVYGDEYADFVTAMWTTVAIFAPVGLVAGATFDPFVDADKIGVRYQLMTRHRGLTGLLSIALALAAQVIVALPPAIRAVFEGPFAGDASQLLAPLLYALLPLAGALIAWLVMFFVIWPLIHLIDVLWRVITRRQIGSRVTAPLALFLLLAATSALTVPLATGSGTVGTGEGTMVVRGSRSISAVLSTVFQSPLSALAATMLLLTVLAFAWLVVELLSIQRRGSAARATSCPGSPPQRHPQQQPRDRGSTPA